MPSPRNSIGAVAALFALMFGLPADAGPVRLPMVPSPKEVAVQSGETLLSEAWTLQVIGSAPDSVGVEGLQADVQRAFGWTWKLSHTSVNRLIKIRPRPNFEKGVPLLESQGYELSVSRDSIVVSAPTTIGRFYGVQSLRQLIRGARGRALPRVVIRDYPTLAWRGVSDDISRGQASTLADFRATLERLAFYKVNLYCIYLEDMARFWSAPESGADRGALTPSELRLITSEARRHHITIMPIFQTLGHQERLLAQQAFMRYSERPKPHPVVAWFHRVVWTLLPAVAQSWGINDPSETPPPTTCFSAVNTQTRARVAELVNEIAASTPSPFFHVGGDEPTDLGKGTSKNAVEKRGLGAVYADYMSAMTSHVETRLERQPVIFSDVLLKEPAAMSAVPKSTAIMDWHYEPTDKGESLARLNAAGFRAVFASPGLWNWFAIYPDYGRAFPNITNLSRAAKQANVAGLVVASWGDGGAESLRRANWTGYAFAADAAWNEATAPEDFLDRFAVSEYGSGSEALARAELLLGWQSFPTLGFNQRLFHWKPLLRTHDESWLMRMTSLSRDMAEARQLLRQAQSRARFGQERIDVLDHAAARFQYAAERELTMETVAERLGDRPWSSLSPTEQESSLSAIGGLRDSAQALRERFAELWRRDNRQPRLGSLLSRMHEQTDALETMMGQARAGTLRAQSKTGVPSIPKERGAHDAGD